MSDPVLYLIGTFSINPQRRAVRDALVFVTTQLAASNYPIRPAGHTVLEQRRSARRSANYFDLGLLTAASGTQWSSSTVRKLAESRSPLPGKAENICSF
jgi:hypothetical protein